MSSRWWPKDWDRRYKQPKSVSSVGFLGSVFCSTPMGTSLWSQVCNEVLKHPANLLSDVLFANRHIISSDQLLALLVLVWWPRRRRRRSHCLFRIQQWRLVQHQLYQNRRVFHWQKCKKCHWRLFLMENMSSPSSRLAFSKWMNLLPSIFLSVCPFSNKDDFVKTICCVRLTENSRSLFDNLHKRKCNKLLRLN